MALLTRAAFAVPTALPPIPLHVPRVTRRLASLSLRNFAPPTKNYRPPRSLVSHDSPPPRNIAVIGAGLAGLATTYHLLHSTSRLLRKRGAAAAPSVTVFDPCPPGSSGASAAAAGLLHPFTPRVKKRAWRAVKGVDAARRLLDVAQAVSPDPLYRPTGLLRLALSDAHVADFRTAAARFPRDVEYLEPGETAFRFPAVAPRPAAFLPAAVVVDTPPYLRALWRVCEASGRASWRPDPVHDVRRLLRGPDPAYDAVVVCAGAAVKRISDLHAFPITPCRGQNLLLRGDCRGLSVPVIAGKYVIPDLFGRGVIAGATFEYRHEHESEQHFLQNLSKTDVPRALAELRDPLHKLVPDLLDTHEVVASVAGTRALPPRSEAGSVPIACRVRGTPDDVSLWVFTGLGSRGLLHHAYLGRMVAHAVAAGNENLIPLDARRYDVSLGADVDAPAEFAAAAHGQ